MVDVILRSVPAYANPADISLASESGSRAWIPTDLGTDLLGWWDAQDLASITKNGSNEVSAWNDKSGNARHATGSAPIYNATGGPSSKPAIVFAGFGAGTLAVASSVIAGISLAAVVRPSETGGGASYRGITATGDSNGEMLLANMGTDNKWGTYGAGNYPAGSQLAASTNYTLIMDGAASGGFYQSGSSSGTYAVSEGQPVSGFGHIGGQNGGGQTFAGAIGEIVWANDLSDTNREKLEGYFAHHWETTADLPALHPYKTTAPMVAGSGAIVGTASITEEADSLSTIAALAIVGTGSNFEAGDTLTAPAKVDIAATSAPTETDDLVAAAGLLPIVGLSFPTEAADSISASGAVALVASCNATEGADTLAAISAVILAGLASTAEANDTASSTASLAIAATLSASEANDTLASTGGAPALTASATITEASDSVAAVSALPIVGAASQSEANDSVAASSVLNLAASSAITEANDAVASASRLALAGALATTEANDAAASAATLAILGSLGLTEADDAISATGGAVPNYGAASIVEAAEIGRAHV